MPSYASLTVTSGSTITEAWGNAMRDSTVIVCTSSTRPSGPHEGMTIVETDTNRMAIYSGSAWVYVSQFASTSWTPVPYRVSAPSDPTYTVNRAVFSYSAGWVMGQADITFTQAATSGYENRVSTSSLPAPLSSGATSCGTFQFVDVGVDYKVGSVIFDGTNFIFRCDRETSQLGLAPTFNISVGDTWGFSFAYPVV